MRSGLARSASQGPGSGLGIGDSGKTEKGEKNMSQIIEFTIAYGPLILFLAGFAEQSGLPFPGSLFVIAAGALAANGKLDLLAVVGCTALGCITADTILFLLGRQGQARVFGVFPYLEAVQVKLERATLAKSILHGMRMLTVAKFVPLGQVVAMHAGAMQVNRRRFLLVDAFSSVIYATVFASLGFAFHNQLEQLVAFLRKLGNAALLVIVVMAGAYGVHRFLRRPRKTMANVNPERTKTGVNRCFPCC